MNTPKIESYRFGQIVIDGESYSKDIIIFPDHVKQNWRRNSGHNLVTDDLYEVLQANISTLVVGQGSFSRMKISTKTRKALDKAGIQLIALPTKAACQHYNNLHRDNPKC